MGYQSVKEKALVNAFEQIESMIDLEFLTPLSNHHDLKKYESFSKTPGITLAKERLERFDFLIEMINKHKDEILRLAKKSFVESGYIKEEGA